MRNPSKSAFPDLASSLGVFNFIFVQFLFHTDNQLTNQHQGLATVIISSLNVCKDTDLSYSCIIHWGGGEGNKPGSTEFSTKPR